MRDLFQAYSYVTEKDYNAVSGPSWPTFNNFVQHKNVPEFVYKEIDQMLPRRLPFEHPSFCVNPFFSKEIPAQTHCCLLPKNYDIQKIRKEMVSGTRPVECNACWTIEDSGQKSDRLIKNETLDYYADIDLELLYEAAIAGEYSELMYKIDTSNACNGICVTCSSSASTSWAKLEQKNNIIPTSPWNLGIHNIDIDYKKAVAISFRGGEPLLSQTNFVVLEKLLEADNTNCLISFTTNGSVQLTPRQHNILEHFSNINMCFSIDGIHKVFEYMRYPLKWQNCVDNMSNYINKGFDVSVSYTLSNINISYYEETIEWFNNKNLPYLINPVYEPSWFRPDALSHEIKQQLWQDYPSPDLKSFLCSHNIQDDLDWQRAKIEIKKQDTWKGIDINDYLPEVNDYFAL